MMMYVRTFSSPSVNEQQMFYFPRSVLLGRWVFSASCFHKVFFYPDFNLCVCVRARCACVFCVLMHDFHALIVHSRGRTKD
jgi:hypothetical protein